MAEQIKINVKLLSNEVYEFEVSSNMTVQQFKQLVANKVNVPVDKQRLVFGGKQLLDPNPISDYVKESGCTLHLIAKKTEPTPPTNTTQTPNISHQPNPQPQPQNIFGSLINMFRPLTQNIPQSQTTQNQSINLNMEPLMRNIGQLFNIPTPSNFPVIQIRQNQHVSEHTHQPMSSTPQPMPSNPPPASTDPRQNEGVRSNQTIPPSQNQAPLPQNVASSALNPEPFPSLQILSNSINLLDLPFDNSLSPAVIERERTLAYLRRFLHEMLRFIPQLNRGIQLMSEGRVSHLGGFLRIFQNLSRANGIASQAIQHLLLTNNIHPNQPLQPTHIQMPQPQQTHMPQPQQTHISQPQPQQQQTRINIVHFSQQQVPPQLNTLINSFNVVNNNRRQEAVTREEVITREEPVVSVQITAEQRVQQMDVQSSPEINLSSMLSLLSNQGSMQNLLGSSFGESYAQMYPQDIVYQYLLSPFSAQDILGVIISKNFGFLDTKRALIRDYLQKAIVSAGSRDHLLHRLQNNFFSIVSPPENCLRHIQRIFRQRISQLFEIILETSTPRFSERIVHLLKLVLCETIQEIEENSTQRTAIGKIKMNLSGKIQMFINMPFLINPFMKIIEDNLTSIYKDYREEKMRKQERSETQVRNEEELLKQIEEQAEKDKKYLQSFEHSEYYQKK